MTPLTNLKSAEIEYGVSNSTRKQYSPTRFSPEHIRSILTASTQIPSHQFNRELTPFEQEELQLISEVYFTGRSKPLTSLSHLDDEHGDYQAVPGDHLCYRYEVLSLLGSGSFGRVWKCFDHKNNLQVAIKIIKNNEKLTAQGLVEAQALETMLRVDALDSNHIVRLKGNAHFRGHLCLVFELLCYSLYELLRSRNYEGLPIPLVRRFTWQLTTALSFLSKQRIIHCDLKPENVMLSRLNSASIKLIDFGSCCFSDSRIYTYIQSRFYRAPEIVLGIPYTTQIDMWSLGCLVVELVTGTPLFPSESEEDLVVRMVQMIGTPRMKHVRQGCRYQLFFEESGRVKVPEKWLGREIGQRTLASVMKTTDTAVLEFVEGCLRWEPSQRLTPDAALASQWLVGLS